MGSEDRRIILRTLWIACWGFLASIALSHESWFVLHNTPIISALPFSTPSWVIQALAGSIVFLTALYPIANQSRIIPRLLMVLLLVLFVLHQQLITPWSWFFFILIWIVSSYARHHAYYKDLSPITAALRLFIACFYVFIGVYKLTPAFESIALPYLLQPITNYLWQFKEWILAFFSIIPFLEIGLGISLLILPIARLSKFAIMGFQLFLLLLIGPIGLGIHKPIWPWYVTLIGIVWILFPTAKSKVRVFPFWNLKSKQPFNLVFVTVFLFALLHIIGWGHPYLAFDTYSGRIQYQEVSLLKSKVKRVPASLDPFTFAEGKYVYVDYYHWQVTTTQLPPCPTPFCKNMMQEELEKELQTP